MFLAVAVFGMIAATSCKKDTQESVTDAIEQTTDDAVENAQSTLNQVTEAAKTAAEGTIDIPQFSNEDVQKFASEYANYYSNLMTAAQSGDAEKLQELTKQGVDWAKKASEFTQKMTPEDSQKWIEWTNKLRAMVEGQ